MRVRERRGDQLRRDRGVGALGPEQRDDPPGAVGVVERERALEPRADDRRVDARARERTRATAPRFSSDPSTTSSQR